MRIAVVLMPLITVPACLLLHILIWRIRKPVDHARALLLTFLIPLLLVPWVAGLFGFSASVLEWGAIFLLHLGLSASYILVYPASQADSPSMRIMMLVAKAMPKGLTAKELTEQFDAAVLFHDRIDDLAAVGHVQRDRERVVLTSRGRFLILPFIWIRRMIGLPWGKG